MRKNNSAKEFLESLKQLEEEKQIDSEIIISAVETALVTACKKDIVTNGNIEVKIDRETGEYQVFSTREVKAEPNPELNELSIEEAREFIADPEEGDIIKEMIPVNQDTFGRVAAQTAKQVIMQKLREAEREIVYTDFSGKVGELASGIIQKVSRNVIIVNLGKVEAIMPRNEQVPSERYQMNQRIKVIITEVNQTPKGPQVIVSRASNDFIKRLFEQEIPEVYDGIVEIKGIIREAGSKTKVAVTSHDEDVEPLGACVGRAGQRINSIMDELVNEKIDIVVWSNDIKEYIKAALSPASVVDIELDEEEKSAEVIVPETELSLAIGKSGQNVRMAARLVGCKIDIKGDGASNESEDEEAEVVEEVEETTTDEE